MKFMLDSNIVIAASLGLSPNLRARMAECDEGDLVTSAVVYAEVAFGSMRGKPPLIGQLQRFIEEVPVLDFDIAAAIAYGSVRFKRDSFDQLIAAHALSLGLVMITDNVEHFARVDGLTIENWLE